MKKEELLKILKEGAVTWNQWRSENQQLIPDLSGAVVVQSNLLQNAKLTRCRIYGISAWNVEFSENTEQQGLIITPHNQPTITVDNLEVAQFISFLSELAAIVPLLSKTPVLPLRLVGSGGSRMFDELKHYHWVLDIHEYEDAGSLHSNLPMIIAPVIEMAEKLCKTM